MESYKAYYKAGEINELIILGPEYYFQGPILVEKFGYRYLGKATAENADKAKNIFLLRIDTRG